MTVDKQTSTEPDAEAKVDRPPRSARRNIAATLGLDRFSGIYVWAAMIRALVAVSNRLGTHSEKIRISAAHT